MYDFINFIKTLHGYFGILSFFLLLILLIKLIIDFTSKTRNLNKVKTISKFTVLSIHIQLLLGIGILILNSGIFDNISGKIGSTSVSYIEHMASNIIGIIVLTIFNAKLKRTESIKIPLVIMLVVGILLLSRVVPLIINVFKN